MQEHIKKILTSFAQLVTSYILGFITPYSLGIGNGMELLAIPLGMTAGVCLAGTIRYPLSWKRFLASLLGAALGTSILAIPHIALGFAGLTFPFIGAIVGFYGAPANRASAASQEIQSHNKSA